ncbi:hypothetical protein CUMW_165030 [Citrus unshiu]|nr:hypothetical protein CUMW_165030 [Citrus unshiu]
MDRIWIDVQSVKSDPRTPLHSSDIEEYLFHIEEPPQEWDGGVGFISKEMILTHCPSSSL